MYSSIGCREEEKEEQEKSEQEQQVGRDCVEAEYLDIPRTRSLFSLRGGCEGNAVDVWWCCHGVHIVSCCEAGRIACAFGATVDPCGV